MDDRTPLHLDTGLELVEAALEHGLTQRFLVGFLAIEEKKASAARAEKLATPCPGGEAGLVERIDALVGDVGSEAALEEPVGVEEVADRIEFTANRTLDHGETDRYITIGKGHPT